VHGGGGGLSGEEDGDGEVWSPQTDVSAFAMLLFEIVAGHPLPSPRATKAHGQVILPPDVPEFVSAIIEEGPRLRARMEPSFIGIFRTWKEDALQILAGVDSDDVSAFVSRVESAEQSGESE
jgi:hypothetical protein